MPWWLTLRYLRDRTGRLRLRHLVMGYLVLAGHFVVVVAQVLVGLPLLARDVLFRRSPR